jgi:hypothetical protein
MGRAQRKCELHSGLVSGVLLLFVSLLALVLLRICSEKVPSLTGLFDEPMKDAVPFSLKPRLQTKSALVIPKPERTECQDHSDSLTATSLGSRAMDLTRSSPGSPNVLARLVYRLARNTERCSPIRCSNV